MACSKRVSCSRNRLVVCDINLKQFQPGSARWMMFTEHINGGLAALDIPNAENYRGIAVMIESGLHGSKADTLIRTCNEYSFHGYSPGVSD